MSGVFVRHARGTIRAHVVAGLLVLTVGATSEAGAREDAPAATRIAGSIMVSGRAVKYLEELTEGYPARLSGSRAYAGAAAWAAAQLRAAGVARVWTEPVTLASSWEPISAQGRVVAPIARKLHLASDGWSPSTAPGGVAGEIVIVTDVTPGRVAALKGSVKGRIVLFDSAALFPPGPDRFALTVSRLRQALLTFEAGGAVASIIGGKVPNQAMKPSGLLSLSDNGRLARLPVALLGSEDAQWLSRVRQRGPVTVAFRLSNRTRGPVRVDTVLGEIRGRERPQEIVLLGAHLDGWHLGTGAQDNGTGVAMVLEAARAIAAAGTPPRRTIRFALWAAEERGFLGSGAYARAHAKELDRHVAVLNSDSGAGEIKGWLTERDDVAAALRPLGRSLLAGLGGEIQTEVSCTSAHAPFVVRGVPTLDLWVDLSAYWAMHHLAADTIDKVPPARLAQGSALAAVTAWALAERQDRLAPRLSPAKVEALLKGADQLPCRDHLLP